MSGAEFYDDYVAYQVESGINDRIWSLYQRLIRLGIKNNSSILEIGCGIGALTLLLSKKVRRGRIEATDLSPRSIAYAKTHLQKENVSFSASDIFEFSPATKPFDKILLFDVLEHIPKDLHEKLFQRLGSWLHQDGQVHINIPNPAYILYDQQHNPAALQELDQPVYISELLPYCQAAGLELVYFETYSVWVENDYQFFTLQKGKEFHEKSVELNLFQKVFRRISRERRKRLLKK